MSLGLPSIALLRMGVQERGSSAFSSELAPLFKIQSVVSCISLIRKQGIAVYNANIEISMETIKKWPFS